jgi:hypothetical protein
MANDGEVTRSTSNDVTASWHTMVNIRRHYAIDIQCVLACDGNAGPENSVNGADGRGMLPTWHRELGRMGL